MFSLMLDHERDSLIAPCHRWVDRLSDETYRQPSEILDVFRGGSYVKPMLRSRQGCQRRGWTAPRPLTETLLPHGDVEPWQCAGPFVHNDIDLAFKLWLENDTDFTALLERHWLHDVFSVVGLWSIRTAERGSLFRLNGFLVSALIDDVNSLSRIGEFLQHQAERQQATSGGEHCQSAREAEQGQIAEG